MKVKLNQISLDYNKTHIVLEAGPTHTGLESAKKLVDLAVSAKADSIKFQTIDADRLMADKTIGLSTPIYQKMKRMKKSM